MSYAMGVDTVELARSDIELTHNKNTIACSEPRRRLDLMLRNSLSWWMKFMYMINSNTIANAVFCMALLVSIRRKHGNSRRMQHPLAQGDCVFVLVLGALFFVNIYICFAHVRSPQPHSERRKLQT